MRPAASIVNLLGKAKRAFLYLITPISSSSSLEAACLYQGIKFNCVREEKHETLVHRVLWLNLTLFLIR